MSRPSDTELSRLSEEAGRLLDGLSDSSHPANSEPTSDDINSHRISINPNKTHPDTLLDQDDIGFYIKKQLFAAAISELKRRGILKTDGPPPSLDRSRESNSSFVVCDSQNKVIGRVALTLLHSRIKQIPTKTPNTSSPSPLTASIPTDQESRFLSTILDDTVLMFVNELTPNERTMFLTEYNNKKKTVTTGVVLALFLGGLGAHKFWLGSFTAGIIYLFFCWTFIPGIVALIDACLMSFTVHRYNTGIAKTAYRKIMMLR